MRDSLLKDFCSWPFFGHKCWAIFDCFVICLVVGSVNHPFHLHGNPFVVIGLGQDPDGVPMTLNRAYELDRTHRLNRNLQNLQPPIKDTISIPSRGYAIIRVLATNPGELNISKHFILNFIRIFHFYFYL